MSRAVPGPVKLRITVLRRVPQDILEGDIQHENSDQHCREDPRRGCLTAEKEIETLLRLLGSPSERQRNS